MASRILVLGASGVGKTTLARGLAARLGGVHFDSDDYFHEPTDPPFRVPREPMVRRALLEADLAPHASWVLSGGAATWQPAPRLDPTAVVFLRLPADERLERLRAREQLLYGARISSGGDMAGDHASFLAWTAGYDDSTAEGTNTLDAHEAFLARATCRIVRVEPHRSAEHTLQAVLARLALRLRTSHEDDVPAIAQLFTDSVHELGREHYDTQQRDAWAPLAFDLDEWRARLSTMDVLVAEDDGGLAGFLVYSPDGYVSMLFTASRTARRGVASLLYRHVERSWLRSGVPRAFAEVSLTARPFFERQGFTATEEQDVERGGVRFRRFLMHKTLAAPANEP